MFMTLTNSLVVLFIAVLCRYFDATFTEMLRVFHCCGYTLAYLDNSQVSVYRTIGPTLFFLAIWIETTGIKIHILN